MYRWRSFLNTDSAPSQYSRQGKRQRLPLEEIEEASWNTLCQAKLDCVLDFRRYPTITAGCRERGAAKRKRCGRLEDKQAVSR